jgi:hypothetical protein
VILAVPAPGRGLRFGGGERGPGLAGVAMAELGVGGLGQAEPPAGNRGHIHTGSRTPGCSSRSDKDGRGEAQP